MTPLGAKLKRNDRRRQAVKWAAAWVLFRISPRALCWFGHRRPPTPRDVVANVVLHLEDT